MSQSSLARTPASLLSSPYHYASTVDAFKKMYHHEGLRSFYSGLGPALLGLTHVAVQFPLYEFLKSTFTGGTGLGQTSQDGGSNFVAILCASVLSKIAASSATYPHEVLRTRLQTQRILRGHAIENGVSEYPVYKGLARSVRMIWREEGWRAFYAGMGTNMIRAVPASAVTMITFEGE
jgi:solute carrier family 25 folate transporter 32